MFTGIVEAIGTVRGVEPRDRVTTLTIEAPPPFLEGVRAGDSIAVDGACLTPVSVAADHFTVDAIGTTLGRTVAGRYLPGTRVNLERAMILGSRIDGHIVQGHIDGIGHVEQILDDGDFRRIRVHIPSDIHGGTIPHGSITLNGVSLTVNALEEPDLVEVGIIPHTWTHTNLSLLAPGDPVNVEGDMIGKYVARRLDVGARSSSPHDPVPPIAAGRDPE